MSSGVARDCARVTPPKRRPRWVLGEILTRPPFYTVQQHHATVIYSNGSPFSRFVFSTVSCFSLQMVCVCVCIVAPYQNTGNAKQFQLHRCVGQKAGDFYELSGSVTASFHVVLMVLSRKKNGKTHTHSTGKGGREKNV